MYRWAQLLAEDYRTQSVCRVVAGTFGGQLGLLKGLSLWTSREHLHFLHKLRERKEGISAFTKVVCRPSVITVFPCLTSSFASLVASLVGQHLGNCIFASTARFLLYLHKTMKKTLLLTLTKATKLRVAAFSFSSFFSEITWITCWSRLPLPRSLCCFSLLVCQDIHMELHEWLVDLVKTDSSALGKKVGFSDDDQLLLGK